MEEHLKQIQDCLHQFYSRQGYIDKEMQRAQKCLQAGEIYRLKKQAFSKKRAVMVKEIAFDTTNNTYRFAYGWAGSSFTHRANSPKW